MSNLVFPSLPGVDINVERETIYSTTTRTSVSGKEYRTSWQASPRYRYKLKFNLRTAWSAPSPFGAYNEVSVVQAFLDTHLGSWDSFLYTDPYSGSQVRVRFERDNLNLKQELTGAWSCSFNLISVL